VIEAPADPPDMTGAGRHLSGWKAKRAFGGNGRSRDDIEYVVFVLS